MALLPIRSRVLHYLSTVKAANVSQILEALTPEYGGERQFNWARIFDHLMNLKENALIDEMGFELNGEKLDIMYAINDEGINIVGKYLPRAWRETGNIPV